MADYKYKGVRFPFRPSEKGLMTDMTISEKDRIKSNIIALLTTVKGERWYRPNYGVALSRFMFEPVDDKSVQLIRDEISRAITSNFNTVEVISIEEIINANNKNFIGFTLTFKIKNDMYQQQDTTTVLF